MAANGCVGPLLYGFSVCMAIIWCMCLVCKMDLFEICLLCKFGHVLTLFLFLFPNSALAPIELICRSHGLSMCINGFCTENPNMLEISIHWCWWNYVTWSLYHRPWPWRRTKFLLTWLQRLCDSWFSSNGSFVDFQCLQNKGNRLFSLSTWSNCCCLQN